MTPEQATQRFVERVPMLSALGDYVVTEVKRAVEEVLTPGEKKGFFKIEPSARVKEPDSFREKITRKGKSYVDPLREITDQVGARFVVLLSEDVALVNRIIGGFREWKLTHARDVDEERRQNPYHFDYLSHHWVIELKEDKAFEGGTISAGVPCEIQVRTLLQHAYAELAHSTIYKPNLTAKPEVKRAIAKGAALVETTDGVFDEVARKIRDHFEEVTKHLRNADQWFRANVGDPDTSKANEVRSMRVLDTFCDVLAAAPWEKIERSFSTRAWMPEWLRSMGLTFEFYRHPCILLVFWLVAEFEQECADLWPIDLGILQPIFTQLGKSADGSLD
jgi:ppGpp synthetase/RelA/SpoT-type nucleotidyltranferase